jgi:polyisoprenoid-binding protein YceI
MKNLVFALLAAHVIVASAGAQTVRYTATPGSKLKMDGTSTVHDWTVESSLIGGSLEWDAAFDAAPKPGKVNAQVQSMILVRSLKSGKSAMDAVMQEAMNAEKHPKIEYKLTELTLKEAPKNPTDPMNFDSKGELTVSGVTKPLTMPVTITRLEGGKLKVTGSAAIKMTDHGIKPPAPAIGLGLIKTGDEVKISFDWVTKKAQ